ncbi:MAG: DUF4332 domain-containing protein [Candidatus Thorarchaeota archaeon]
MDEDDFRKYLKKSGRKNTAINQITEYTQEFEKFFMNRHPSSQIDEVSILDLEDFVAEIESESKVSANKHLWALWYLFDFLGEEDIMKTAKEMRSERIKRLPFKLEKFMDVNEEHIAALKKHGIGNVKQMLERGKTPTLRQELAKKTGVPLEYILELVQLSDLTRIGAIRSIRARLYHNAGIISPSYMAKWDPTELRNMLLGFVEETGFQGIAPLPKEAESSVAAAKKLKPIVEY